MSKTAILLCTYNGAKYLKEQLNSLATQTVNWQLFVSDDGSTDDTLLILKDFAKNHEVTIFKGPQKGFVQNFLSLMKRPEVMGDFYAFCDQDDVWLKDKLARGLEFVSDKPEPQLYCSRTITACETLHPVGLSPLFRRKPTFKNALVQSIAGANTFIFNNATRDLVIKAESMNVISHDWWLYQLVTGAEGHIFYDESSYILYRQHNSNLVGANSSWKARLDRIFRLHKGQFKTWNDANLTALNECRHLLTIKNRIILDNLIAARKEKWFYKYYHFFKSGVYRQTNADNISLLGALALGKL